ncbi:inhibitor of Bruton tyrosine kinase isoform X5 [Tachysurus fulvidraco]|uniref:inhibitor of Bruton tyrosine kinase isoform X5 n=1 Tax=Tachysurus fulvidraco TaxID=1234273 RepID=UPI001FEDD5BC|nr:inhibitor of Bruton tyrosine kinase isoform X5 [Tachysurus fulvidraco]
MSLVAPECTPKCHSPRHAEMIVAALTGGSEGQLKTFLSAYCHNAATLKDEFGRTALHLAASLGKRALLEWLLDSKSADLLLKDKESGWTALHRSAFYGQIHCIMALIKRGSSLSIPDKEGLSVLDLTMKDRPAHVVFQSNDPTEVYTWGNNTNFSLGHGNQDCRNSPEIVDLFVRTRVYIKQVVVCKFHSVFLSQKGQVYTCGHGQGGRLGHGDEQTYLVPRIVEGLVSHHCAQVAAARDHTVVLTEEGYVYSFGLNTYNQLGLTPPVASQVPKQVTSKCLKGKNVIGVAAGRFHTVLWTRDAVYTVGLNGGQLGYLLDPNGEKCVAVPRQVSALHHKDVTIAMAAASNGATVCLTEKGDIYLLADYQCKKLASKQLNIKKVLVNGGTLDHRVDPHLLNESGGEKISILALDEIGRVFCWRSVGTSLRQCRWAYGRQVFMSDIAIGKSKMMFITQDGEGFSGQWLGEYKKGIDKKEVNSQSESGSVYERIRLERLPNIHRAVSITMDSKGRNFGVLQSDPKTSIYEVPTVSASLFTQHFKQLLAEADETDSIHDVTLQAGDRVFPTHKFILSTRSEFFRKQLLPEADQEDEVNGEVKRTIDAVGCDLLVLENLSPDLLEQALQFIYTDSCEMLVHGARPTISRLIHGPEQKQQQQQQQQQLICSLKDLNVSGRSALEIYRSLPASVLSQGEKPTSKGAKSGKKEKTGNANEPTHNPVKMLQGVAKKLGLGSLSARLDGVKYENGQISVVQKKTGNRPRFYLKKWCDVIPYLCDVTLRSEDGKEFPCHKCILCARLEYFNSMLGNPWIESTSCTALEMPTSAKVLQVILEYIYTDESPTIRESLSVEFVCNVLVVADQLLITRLKEICEVVITENLTLKNSAELLEFAVMYNAEQLKLSCLQFIVLNITALLESKALEILSDDVLLELSEAYRKTIPAMQRRHITPYLSAPDLSSYEDMSLDSISSCKNSFEQEQSYNDGLLKKTKVKSKKKPRRRLDSSGGYNLSDIIQSSPTDIIPSPPSLGLVGSRKACSVESLHELITSDSEGSYIGVGSPRDLQSPVFQDRPYVQEEKSRHVSWKTSPSTTTWSTGSLPVKCSTPEPIPKVKASPSRPVPVLDLRAIMEMEANSLNLGATPKSPSSSGNSSKASVIPNKLSQKQRKMIAMATREASVDGVSAKSPPGIVSVKPAKSWLYPCIPRATAVQSPPSSLSFRDLLMEAEQHDKSSATAAMAAGSPVSAVGKATCAKRVTFKCAEPGNAGKHAGPWVLGQVGSPPAATTVNFASIIEEEKQQEAALIRSREKPLALIQIEERAIQDLLVYYRAFNNPDELIMVERSPQGPIAAPTWNKH